MLIFHMEFHNHRNLGSSSNPAVDYEGKSYKYFVRSGLALELELPL